MSDYPRDYSFKNDGSRCEIAYRALRKVSVADYADASQTLEKFIVEGKLRDGETISVWLGESGKLVSLFREELSRRIGKTDFEPGERIVITRSDEQRPSRTSTFQMWDWDVEFEFAAPAPSAAALLLDGGATNGGADLDKVAVGVADEDGYVAVTGHDDIPF